MLTTPLPVYVRMYVCVCVVVHTGRRTVQRNDIVVVAQPVDDCRLASSVNPTVESARGSSMASLASAADELSGIGMELGAAARGQLHMAPSDDAAVTETLDAVVDVGPPEEVR